MKKLIALVVVLSLMLSVFAGGSQEEASTQESPVQIAIKEASTLNWDDLLAKAKAEIGDNELVIYGTTSRVKENSFTEKTGIKIKTEQPDDTQIYEKMQAEVGNGIYGADVFVTTDSFNLVNLAFANGWAENYIPAEYSEKIAEGDKNPLVALYYGRLFIYNNGGEIQNYIKNIWQVTEPEFKGIEMKSPLLEKCSMNFLITLTSPAWQAKLAEAYKSYYGKDWVNDGTYTNISYEWIHKFIQNCSFINKDSTIAKDLAAGAKGSTGFFVFSKFRSVDYSKLSVAAIEGVEGFGGMLYPIYSVIAANAKYPYTACLYINYLLSEEGFMNIFGKDMGAYSSNTAIAISEKAKSVGDQDLAFWLDKCVLEDSAYIPTVYAQAYTKIASWCAGK
ncbi:MAG: hypothetical protein K6G51_06950 [Sphaerochaetaceae bacterium]|nr:hypothetical protein [Sphaerochaetaceae bacterium]